VTGELRPHPEYKDSGTKWLGEVPAHWEVRRGKVLFRLVKRPVRSDDEVITCFRDGEVLLRRRRRLQGFTEALQETGYQGIRQGDLVIHQMDAFAGAVGVAQDSGKGSPVYAVCVSNGGANAEYFKFVVREMARRGWIESLAKGIRERSTDFRFETFGSQRLPHPCLDEQAAIVRYLDHFDRRIRRLIAAKERLIALLEEEKQSIINSAVTRGLDPSAPMKDSGVDWLGEVPAHWEVSSVKREFACLNHRRRPLSSTERGSRQGPFPYYGASGIIDHVDDFLFDEELLLIAEDGANLVLRNLPLAIVATGSYWVNNHAHILRPRRGKLNFLKAKMESLDYRPYISGAAQPKLTMDRLLNMPIAVPPPDEQGRLLATLDEETHPLTEVRDKAHREILLLREYRTRLISDVVTGNLDVREAAAKLPDQSMSSTETTTSAEIVDSPATIAGSTDAESESVMARS
jgi:type I restriction enzyme, S subunit